MFAYGDDGNDELRGNAGDYNLIGGDGNDVLHGRTGKDFLSGADGNDRLIAGAHRDLIDGGAGNDTVDFRESVAGITVDLRITLKPVPGLDGYAQGDLLQGVENIVGAKLADTFIGDGGDNRFNGDAGNDQLDGSGGNDCLTGGSGNDHFMFVPDFGHDRIKDFDANPDNGQDVVDLSALDILATDFARRVTIADAGDDTLVTIDSDPNQTILLDDIGNAAAITLKDFAL